MGFTRTLHGFEDCETFLDPLIESWDIDLTDFKLQVVLNQRVAARPVKRFEFVERAPEEEQGFRGFLDDATLSGTATHDEVAWLRQLTFQGRRPTPLFYYRELQSLRDPLNFGPPPEPGVT